MLFLSTYDLLLPRFVFLSVYNFLLPPEGIYPSTLTNVRLVVEDWVLKYKSDSTVIVIVNRGLGAYITYSNSYILKIAVRY